MSGMLNSKCSAVHTALATKDGDFRLLSCDVQSFGVLEVVPFIPIHLDVHPDVLCLVKDVVREGLQRLKCRLEVCGQSGASRAPGVADLS